MLKTFYVGVKALITHQDKVLLLQKRRNNGDTFWDIPGGRIDDNETVHAALNRELKEEVPSIGEYRIGALLDAYRYTEDMDDGLGLLLLLYEVEADPFEVVLSEEHFGYEWVSREELETLVADSDMPINDGYLDAAKRALEN